VGLELDVATRLEVVDHVVPGVVMLAGAAVLATRAGVAGDRVWMGAGGIAFLTGLWITATHVPLIPAAVDGLAPWGTALLHLSAGPPILVLGVWMLLRPRTLRLPRAPDLIGDRGKRSRRRLRLAWPGTPHAHRWGRDAKRDRPAVKAGPVPRASQRTVRRWRLRGFRAPGRTASRRECAARSSP
jgi:hypothetical protein